MNTPPDLDPALIEAALREHWAFAPSELAHAPVGFGSHHWVATAAGGERCFVTVDHLVGHHLSHRPEVAFDRLRQAFSAARALADGGLDFVVAPLTTAGSGVLVRLAEGYAMAVMRFVEGTTPAFGAEESGERRQARLERFQAVHGATRLVEGIAGRETFEIAGREVVERSLEELREPWRCGPYGEPARRLLRDRAARIAAGFAFHDRLVEDVRSRDEPWVITHGEPHHANAIWTTSGPRLIDWDTALIAPAARDLWMFAEPRPGEDPALTLYRLRWDLRDLAAYVTTFRRSHGADEDTALAWRGLQGLLGPANTIGRRAEVAQLGRAPH